MVGLFALSSLMLVGLARASFLTDIPNEMADSLSISVAVARLIIASGIILSVALVVSMAGRRANPIATAAAMVTTIGLLTGLGWLSPVILLLVGLIVAYLFGKPIGAWISGAH